MSELQKTSKTFSNPISWWILNILTTCFIATAICAFTVRSAKTSGNIRVLRLGHGLSADHPVHQAMECFKQAQNAQIEFAKCSAAVLDGSVPEFQVVGAPFLFRDSEHFWAVMNGEIGKSLLRKIDGLMGICYFDAGARSLYTTKKPVRSAEDMKGLKIRTQKSSIAMQSMEALGASPTPISWGELYTALSQGTVDAAENNIPSFVTGRHFEVCKYFIFTEHQRVPDVLVMSRKIWDELTAEQKSWIEQAAADANVFQRQAWRESEVLNEQIAREAGVEFINVDRAPFIELSKPIYDAFPAELQDLAKRSREVK